MNDLMKEHGNTFFQRTLRTLLRFLGLAWSKITDAGFLTLLIALGTLGTAFVAYQTAQDTHEQVQLLKRQVNFNSSETRPFFRLMSSAPDNGLRVTLNVSNPGRVPGRLIAYDMVVQVGRNVHEPKGGVFNSGDILYPDRAGLGVYETLTQVEATSFHKGLEPPVAGGCVIYGPIAGDDTRRWKVSAAYRMNAHEELPILLLAKETEVPEETDACDASSLHEEWAAQLKLQPK